jgi:mono/diheme cytochrome c family protein
MPIAPSSSRSRLGTRCALLTGLCLTLLIADQHVAASPPTPAAPPVSTAKVVDEPRRTGESHVGSHGSTIIVDTRGLLIAERSVGAVIRADREGRALASLPMSPNLGELVHDGADMVFVADRGGNRVVRIAPGDVHGQGLAEAGSISVREPHGLALTPDGETLLVTSVANHELLAFATKTLELRWRVPLAAEPRPVAVSPDGAVAVVGFLSSGALAVVELSTPEPRVSWRALDPRDHLDIEVIEAEEEAIEGNFNKKYNSGREVNVNEVESRSRFRVPVETGRRYVRNVAALQFAPDGLVAAHQLATPQLEHMPDGNDRGSYGGGDREVQPVAHQVSFISEPGLLGSWVSSRELDISQPQAIARDSSGYMFIGGLDDDAIVMFHDNSTRPIGLPARCGIDGLATDDGTLWIHCGASRNVLKAHVVNDKYGPTLGFVGLPELAKDPRSELVARGAELFVTSDWRFSGSGLACANCHPEGRSDGLSWRLGPEILQTPILAGRVGGTAPYKWTGQDTTLHGSFRQTIKRLGGRPTEVDLDELDALKAYLESLPPPVSRDVTDPEAATRGRALFEEQACDACHDGPKLTDGSQHRFATRLKRVDTPSLLGVGHSSPYYHDGSAHDLWSLLTDKASVHDMADTSGLSDSQLRDLIAYLEGL